MEFQWTFLINPVISIQRRQISRTSHCYFPRHIVILKRKVKPKLSINTIAGDDSLPHRYLRFAILFVSNELTIPRKNSYVKHSPRSQGLPSYSPLER